MTITKHTSGFCNITAEFSSPVPNAKVPYPIQDENMERLSCETGYVQTGNVTVQIQCNATENVFTVINSTDGLDSLCTGSNISRLK